MKEYYGNHVTTIKGFLLQAIASLSPELVSVLQRCAMCSQSFVADHLLHTYYTGTFFDSLTEAILNL